jgi:hypothetical protein
MSLNINQDWETVAKKPRNLLKDLACLPAPINKCYKITDEQISMLEDQINKIEQEMDIKKQEDEEMRDEVDRLAEESKAKSDEA